MSVPTFFFNKFLIYPLYIKSYNFLKENKVKLKLILIIAKSKINISKYSNFSFEGCNKQNLNLKFRIRVRGYRIGFRIFRVIGSSKAPFQHWFIVLFAREFSSSLAAMKDPFEAAAEEQESPPESPIPPEDEAPFAADADEEDLDARSQPGGPSAPPSSNGAGVGGGRGKEEDDEDEDDNMDVELGKFPPGGDPDKMAKMQLISGTSNSPHCLSLG